MNEHDKGVMFSSRSVEYETPQWLFDQLDSEFHFTLDPCSTHQNAKCKKHYTTTEDGLSMDWRNETVFMNPPYKKYVIDKWVAKAQTESSKTDGAVVVALLPARTDTKWWHNNIQEHICEVRFLKGRLKFSGMKTGAPFPSCIVIFNQRLQPNEIQPGPRKQT